MRLRLLAITSIAVVVLLAAFGVWHHMRVRAAKEDGWNCSRAGEHFYVSKALPTILGEKELIHYFKDEQSFETREPFYTVLQVRNIFGIDVSYYDGWVFGPADGTLDIVERDDDLYTLRDVDIRQWYAWKKFFTETKKDFSLLPEPDTLKTCPFWGSSL